jgi:hypothetical protein
MSRAIVPALALALAVAAPAGTASAASTGVRAAQFTVALEGVQTTSWEKHHFSEGGCDVPIDGAGSETYRFRSAKLRVNAYRTRAGVALVTAKGEPLLRLAGTVQRRGNIAVGRGEVCSYGDGSGETTQPPPPDCGRRKVSATAAIGFSGPHDDTVIVAPGLDEPKDPFANCPTGTRDQFPNLLAFGDAGHIGRRLPARELFRYGRNIVVARGTRTYSDSETSISTSMRWTATFTRVRG